MTPLMLVALAGCGEGPLDPADEMVLWGESEHFVYFMSSGDSVDTAYQELHYAWATAKLELAYPARIEFRKYRDRAHLERVTGEVTNGFAEPERGRFHTIWPQDNHEYIHVIFVSLVGSAPSFFNEGVAVAHHGASLSGSFDGPPLWNGVSAHSLARGVLLSGALPDVTELVITNRFWELDQQMTYPVAGSFVRHLIDEAGVGAFKAFCSRSRWNDSLSEIRHDFQDVYGESLEAWWDRWQGFLHTLPVN